MKIFLDLDGTILDAKYRCYRLYVNLLSHGGFSTVDMLTYWQMKRSKIPEKDIASKTVPITFAKYYVEKRAHLIETMDYLILDSVFDGVYVTLDRWFLDHDLYLVTLRRDEAALNRQLLLFDLHRYFKHIYNSGDEQIKKEDLISHEISDQSDCVIIGDTEVDVEAGKALSIKTVAVTSGIRDRCLLEKMFPDVLAKSICDFKLVGE